MINLRPYPMQLKVLQDQHSIVCLRGSRRSGKGQTILMKTLTVAFGFDQWIKLRTGEAYLINPTSPAVIIVVAPSLSMVRQLHFQPMLALIDATPALKTLVKNVNKSSMTIDLLGNRPSIIYASLGTDGTADNLRGKKCVLALVDEAADIKYDAIDTVLKTSQTDVPGAQLMLFSSPKGKGNNCLYRFSQLAEKFPEIASEHHLTIYDNPYIKPEAIAQEKLLKTEAVFAREYLADYLDFAGQIYQNLGEHSLAAIPEGKPYRAWLGVDFGSANCCLVVVGIYNGKLYVLDSWQNLTGAAMSANNFLDIILKFSKHYDSVCTKADPSRKDTILDMRALGRSSGDVGLSKTVSGYNALIPGISQLQALLEHKNLFIADEHEGRIGNVTPRQLLENLSSACWLTDRDGVVIEGKIPEGTNNHAEDALRYSIASPEPYTLLQTLKGSVGSKAGVPDYANMESPKFDPERVLKENHRRYA